MSLAESIIGVWVGVQDSGAPVVVSYTDGGFFILAMGEEEPVKIEYTLSGNIVTVGGYYRYEVSVAGDRITMLSLTEGSPSFIDMMRYEVQ